MKRFIQTTILTLLLILLASCTDGAAVPANTPTPEPLNDALLFFVEVERAQATANAIEATQVWIYGQMTATQVAKEELGTQQAAASTAMAFAMQATATHEAFMANQAMTQQSFVVTSTAQAIGTATAFPQTATAQSLHQTQTQQAWQATATMDAAYGSAQATAAHGNAQSVELAVERERVTNMTRAWLPWMGFAVLIGLIVVMGIRYSKVRVLQKDAFGALPGVVVEGAIVDPDASTAIIVKKDGTVEFKQGDPDITERKQKVDLVRALPPGKQEVPPIIMDGPRRTPQLEVLNEGTMPRILLDEIEDQIIEED